MPSRTRPLRATDDRPPVAAILSRAWTRRLALGLCASLAALSAAPTAANASGGCAPKLAQVKSFKGHASLEFEASATGVDPGGPWSETVVLERRVDDVRFDLHKLPNKAKTKGQKEKAIGIDFIGEATHGNVEVHDEIGNTETGFTGALTYSGPLNTSGNNVGPAELLIDRRKNQCKYEFFLSFAVSASFSGDEEIRSFVPLVGGGANGGHKHLTGSLKFHDKVGVPASLRDCEVESAAPRCYVFSGGWTSDFATLFLCHSVVAENCAADNTLVGAAEFEWSIWPVFKKHPKKK